MPRTSPKTPPGAFLTRILRVALLLPAAGLLAAWWIGQAATDRWGWSQWLHWMPSTATLTLAGAGLALTAAIARAGRGRRRASRGSGRRRGPVRGPRERWLWRGACLLWTAGVGWLVLVEWRMWAAPGLLAGGAQPQWRVLCWNPANWRVQGFSERLLGHDADFVVVANPPIGARWSMVAEGMGGDDPARGERADSAGVGIFRVVSRDLILSWGGTSLGFESRSTSADPLTDGTRSGWADPGWAAFFEVDTTERLGRPTVVWVIDLPSDPRLPRMRVTARAAEVIDQWRGRIAYREPQTGGMRSRQGRFPEPDLIIGDFNIKHRAASLRNLTGDSADAYSQGGFGPSGTWPRPWPLLHIDQAFVGPSLRATRYRVVNPGAGGHRMQIVDLRAEP